MAYQPLWVKADLRIMAMKRYFTFPKVLGLEPHHQMQFRVKSRKLTEM